MRLPWQPKSKTKQPLPPPTLSPPPTSSGTVTLSAGGGSLDESAEIRVVGDRSSGKTAYMASLAYWPNASSESPVQSVVPVGDREAGEELLAKARDILEQGLQLEPTELQANVDDVKDYGLSIALKEQFGLNRTVRLNINCKDYAGEFFGDLVYKSSDPKLQDYMSDCVLATGILLLIDGTAHRKDNEYGSGLDRFLTALDRADLEGKTRRIAFAISKCEQSQLWVSRHQPRDLATRRFPRLYRKLEAWQESGAGAVDYFTTSAFGVLGNRFPEPNAIQVKRDRLGTASVIREPRFWRPFGLVSPIYWLCTGKRHKELDRD